MKTVLFIIWLIFASNCITGWITHKTLEDYRKHEHDDE